jgi:hypothetical protein
MKTTTETVTPEQAAAWLHPEVNRENRLLRQDQVAFLAKEILEGRWRTTHQGIGFAASGRLLDGQHRLAAIVRAGVAIKIAVTRDMDEDDFRAIDCGMKRANYDRIHLVNDQHQNRIICQAIRTYLFEVGKTNAISVGDLEDEFLTKTDAWIWTGREFADMPARLKKAGILAAFGIYRFVKKEKAETFIDGYRDGSGLPPGSPILKLRNDALTGAGRDCGYWRVVSIMRAHLHDQTLDRVYEAAEDMMGNENASRAVGARSAVRQKAAIKGRRESA